MCLSLQNITGIPSPNLGVRDSQCWSLGAPDDTCATSVRVESHFYFVANEHFNSMQPHLSGEIREHASPPFELHLKKGVGKRLVDDSTYNL